MDTENHVPDDATHYFLWWDGIHIYKKDGKNWFWLTNGKWREPVKTPYHKIVWRFGWYQMAGNYMHKLHKITYSH